MKNHYEFGFSVMTLVFFWFFVCLFSGGDDCHTRVWCIKSGQLLSENKFSDSVPSVVCWSSVEGDTHWSFLSCFSTSSFYHVESETCSVGFFRARRRERWHCSWGMVWMAWRDIQHVLRHSLLFRRLQAKRFIFNRYQQQPWSWGYNSFLLAL